MRPLTGTTLPGYSCLQHSSSAACREGDLATEENAGTKKRKTRIENLVLPSARLESTLHDLHASKARGKRQKTEGILNRTLLVKMYPNLLQKRWMGLARFTSNMWWDSKRRRIIMRQDGITEKGWLKHMTFQQKCLLFNDISAICGERKVFRAIVHLGMLSRGLLRLKHHR
ncbi:hypothetical protein G9A89_019842 [Geosiphon pyriformis]|nr:hypothetical protein G9A89_019842 [Geosiphon pyriformis]